MAVGRRAVDIMVLVVSVIVWAAAIYVLRGPMVRTAVSLLLLWPITAAYNRLSGIDILLPKERWVKSKRFYKRRFMKLRDRVDRLLEEIRRLNRLAVDVERSFRSRESADQQMVAVRNRMHELLAEIQASAGVETEPEADELPAATPESD